MSTIDPADVARRVLDGDDDLLVLDVRSREQFEEWHVPQSKQRDVYEQLADDPETARDALADLPDREIVTVCAKGVLSAEATEQLRALGYDAKTMTDGLEGWARVHRSAPVDADLPGTLHQVARPGTGCLSYVYVEAGEAVVVDPSQYTDEYRSLLDAVDAELVAVLETHAHADHVSGAGDLAAALDAPRYLHPADAGALPGVEPLTESTDIAVGSTPVSVVSTPGHTPGSVTIRLGDAALLTGDTLFLDSVGRPDLDVDTPAELQAGARQLFDSLRRLRAEPADALVLPAHDDGAPNPPVAATLSEVLSDNDLLGLDREGFVETIADGVPETPPNHERIKAINDGRETVEAGEARQLELGPNRCAAE